jgi:transposase
VLSGEATITPKSGPGNVEMIRVLRLTRRSAVVSRSQVTNQLHALTVTAPPALREQLEGRTTRARVAIAAKFLPGDEPDTMLATTRYAMKKLALRFRALDAEIKALDRQITRLVTATAPKVVALRGVGIHTTATLLVTAGDNPERLRSEGAFARLTGTAPIPASSGQTDRFRLSRGGDRQANAALHLIAVNRLLCDPRSKAYAINEPAAPRPTSTSSAVSSATPPESSTPRSSRPSTTPISHCQSRLTATEASVMGAVRRVRALELPHAAPGSRVGVRRGWQ